MPLPAELLPPLKVDMVMEAEAAIAVDNAGCLVQTCSSATEAGRSSMLVDGRAGTAAAVAAATEAAAVAKAAVAQLESKSSSTADFKSLSSGGGGSGSADESSHSATAS